MYKREIISAFVLFVGLAGPVMAELPEISSQELVQAVTDGDQPYLNYQVSYRIEKHYIPGFDRRFAVPEIETLAVSYSTMGEFYRFAVQVSSDDPGEFPDWAYEDAWDGTRRTQWNPYSNHGDIFDRRFNHAFAVPGDFGLSLGTHKTLLGQELSQCQINTVRAETCGDYDCYYVEVTKPTGQRVELWIDPANRMASAQINGL